MFTTNLTANTDVGGWLSPGAHALLLLYHSLVMVLSLLGNLLVLYGTHRFNAINIDAVSLVFIKFLAATDVSIAILSGVPIFVTLISQSWVLGEALCFVLAFLVYIPGVAQTFIILEFTLYKLLLLLRPMSCLAGKWSDTKMCITFVVTYFLTCVHTTCSLMLSRGAIYTPAEMTCCIDKTQPDFQIFGGVSVILISFLPPIMMVVINIGLLVIARKSHMTRYTNLPSLRAVVITLCVSWVYVVSTVPKGAMNFIVGRGHTPPFFLVVFQKEVFFLNTACNPVIYAALNTRFRSFVLRRLNRKVTDVKLNLVDTLEVNKRLGVRRINDEEVQRANSGLLTHSESPC